MHLKTGQVLQLDFCLKKVVTCCELCVFSVTEFCSGNVLSLWDWGNVNTSQQKWIGFAFLAPKELFIMNFYIWSSHTSIPHSKLWKDSGSFVLEYCVHTNISWPPPPPTCHHKFWRSTHIWMSPSIFQTINPLQHTAGCEMGWAIDAFAVNSSFLSVDGITCLIPFKSWRNDLSSGVSYI